MKELVGQGVEKLAKDRDRVGVARHPAVEHVEQARDAVHCCSPETGVAIFDAWPDQRDDDRQQAQAPEGQEVREIPHGVGRIAQGRGQVEMGVAAPSPRGALVRFPVDSGTGSVILRSVFPNPDLTLLPGMFVRAVVKEGVNEQAILISQQAVSRDPKGNPIVLIVDNTGKVQQRMLTLDRATGDKWLVTSGLAPGDHVIVEGLQKVRPGASVKEVPFAAGEKSAAGPENTTRPAAKSN